jgi:hypothetical protein
MIFLINIRSLNPLVTSMTRLRTVGGWCLLGFAAKKIRSAQTKKAE